MCSSFINLNITGFPNRILRFKRRQISHTTCPALNNARPFNLKSLEMSLLLTSPSSNPNLSRRKALQLLALGVSTVLLPHSRAIADTGFNTYKGPNTLGFSFSYPAGWNVKKKPIKTHLSEVIVTNDKDSSTSAGLVVDAVKINSIDKFGTPDIVGNKVVGMELKKDSVTNATLHDARSVTQNGLTYYIIDYSVDSSRGVKRYQAKATIVGNQLYVLTAQAKTDNFEGATRDIFAAILDSFTVATQYL